MDVKRFKHIDDDDRSLYATIGTVSFFSCDLLECMLATRYEYGYCAGPDCSLEKKCGEICIVGQHCHKAREDCQTSTCYECQKTPDDEDIFFFFITEFPWTALIPELRYLMMASKYNWVVFCGPQESGGAEEENRAPGEYQASRYTSRTRRTRLPPRDL